MYSVPTGLSTSAAAEVATRVWLPDTVNVTCTLSPTRAMPVIGSHLHPVDGDDVSGGQAAGVGEVGAGRWRCRG